MRLLIAAAAQPLVSGPAGSSRKLLGNIRTVVTTKVSTPQCPTAGCATHREACLASFWIIRIPLVICHSPEGCKTSN
ncbi:hypothetical protein BDV06DRAFT_183933 [Aspergillus oleicola]